MLVHSISNLMLDAKRQLLNGGARHQVYGKWWGWPGAAVREWAEGVGGRSIRVLDARALGDPGFLGEAPVSLAALELPPNSPPLNLWLPLKARPRPRACCA